MHRLTRILGVATVLVALSGCAESDQPADETPSGPVSSSGGAADAGTDAADLRGGVPDARARRCDGSLGELRVGEDLIVSRGRACRLRGTRVDGDVLVGRGGVLIARGARIDGDVVAEQHRRIKLIRGSAVLGEVRLRGGRAALVADSRVGGDLRSEANIGRQIFRRVEVGGDLRCRDNRRRPTGGANAVTGAEVGQCRHL